MHHLLKPALVIRLSYAFATVSVVVLQAVPVPLAVPPSVLSPFVALPHTLDVPPPPHVSGEVHVPQEVTVRDAPQLSFAVTVPQFFASLAQNDAFVSAVQLLPSATGLRSQGRMPFAVTKRTSDLLSA